MSTTSWIPDPDLSAQDINHILRQAIRTTPGTLIKVRPPTLAYVPYARDEFCACEYDLGEIGRAMDTESLVRRAISKHVGLCLKEGFRLIGKSPETVEYIKKRLLEFEVATTVPFDLVVRDAIYNTIAYSNAFLVVRRDQRFSTGKRIRKDGQMRDPIAGIFPADPTSMRIRRNRWGEVKEYEQYISYTHGKYRPQTKRFDPADVFHIHYDRKTGLAWGTPFIVPVLDDIRLLRNLEELANLICHKGAFPLYHCQVGTEKAPAIEFENGRSEVEDAEEALREHPAEGIFVTSERIDLSAVDAQAAIKDLTKYLSYFENRVVSGLNLSGVDIGRGDTANRGTATTMSKNLQNQCKDMQQVVSIFMTQFFDELLAEGGYRLSEKTRVRFFFPEIDIEAQQVVQNHAMALYQGHAISENEMRNILGKEPVPDAERSSMYFQNVEVPRIREQGAVKAAQAQENATASRNQPTNQSGQKAARTKPANDLDLRVAFRLDQVGRDFLEVLKDVDWNAAKLPDAFTDTVIEALDLGQDPSLRSDVREACLLMSGATEGTLRFYIDRTKRRISDLLFSRRSQLENLSEE